MLASRSLGRRVRLVVGGVALGLALAAPGAARAEHNDDSENAVGLTLGAALVHPTDEATIRSGEPLTELGDGLCDGERIGRTVWYRVTGNGAPITVTTAHSEFDTMLAVYAAPDAAPRLNDLVACNDDAPGEATSELSFPSVAGRSYLIQAGGCCGDQEFSESGDLRIGTSSTGAPLSPTPPLPQVRGTTALRTTPAARGVRVRRLRVSGPNRAHVRVRCSRGCRRFDRTIRSGGGRRTISVATLRDRTLRPGTRIKIWVTKPGHVGTYYSYTVRRARVRRSTEHCLPPNSLRPTRC